VHWIIICKYLVVLYMWTCTEQEGSCCRCCSCEQKAKANTRKQWLGFIF